MDGLRAVLERMELRCIVLAWRRVVVQGRSDKTEGACSDLRRQLKQVQAKTIEAVDTAESEIQRMRHWVEAARATAKTANDELSTTRSDLTACQARAHRLEDSLATATQAARAQSGTVTSLASRIEELEQDQTSRIEELQVAHASRIEELQVAHASRIEELRQLAEQTKSKPVGNSTQSLGCATQAVMPVTSPAPAARCHVGVEAALPSTREAQLRERLGEAVDLLARSGEEVTQLRRRMRLYIVEKGDTLSGAVEEEDEDRADEKASVRMLQGQLREARREAERSETELTRAVADSESNAARADILQHRLTEVESDAERLRSLASRWRDVVMRTPSTRSLRDTPSRQSREEWHTAKGGTSDHQWRVASSLEPVRDMPRPRSLSDEDENPVRSTPAVSLPPQPRRRPPRLDEAVLTPSASPVH